MSSRDEPIDPTEARRENRKLRRAVEVLLDEIESDGKTDVSKARAELPDASRSGISPPWERQGYEDKEAWRADKRGNSENSGGA